jgi:protein-S-isoprenylcysteine O-methyltransferase Ste14
LLYAGIAIFIVGLMIIEIARIPWTTATFDEPITKGIYHYSRHPAYIGIGIASASGLFLLLIIVHIVLSASVVAAEERFCCEKYGDTYREYMNRTPRWIGLPKSGGK